MRRLLIELAIVGGAAERERSKEVLARSSGGGAEVALLEHELPSLREQAAERSTFGRRASARAAGLALSPRGASAAARASSA